MKTKIIIVFFVIYSIAISKWTLVDEDQYNLLYRAIACCDNENCVAAGNEGLGLAKIRRTTNGGQSWENTLLDNKTIDNNGEILYPAECYRVSYPSPELCIVGCHSGYYWISNDKATTWKKYKTKLSQSALDIRMYDNNYGVMTDSRIMAATHNGGLDWEKLEVKIQDSSYQPMLYSYFDLPDSNVIIVEAFRDDKGIFIIRSNDKGKSWIHYPRECEPLSYLFFKDSLVGFSTGNYKVAPSTTPDVIFKTTDGGKTWIKKLDSLTPDHVYGLQKIVCKNNFMIALGQFHHYWYSYDLGETWERDPSVESVSDKSYFLDISLPTENVAYAIGFMGSEIFKNQSVNDVKSEYTLHDFCRLRKNILNLNEEPILELMTESETGTDIYILNSAGQIINSQNLSLQENTSYSLKFTDNYLSSGMYFVLVQNGNRQQLLKLIIL